MDHDCGAEGASRVETATGEVDAGQFGDEEREADSDGGYECACVATSLFHISGGRV